MIDELDVGMNTNILLNILVLIDISVWSKENIEKLLDKFDGYVGENYDTNKLMLSNNPLLSLALTAELLSQIAVAKKKFTSRCNDLQDEILTLGKIYNMKNEVDEDFYDLIMDEDF